MSYEVDVSGVGERALGIVTFSPQQPAGISIIWPGEIGPGQWFRLAPQLDVDNSPGTSMLITGEGVYIDANGMQNAWIGILNNGNSNAVFTINVISTPSHQ